MKPVDCFQIQLNEYLHCCFRNDIIICL